MKAFLNKPYNQFCADCNQPKPQRINLNLQIIICSECAILHTELFNRKYQVIDANIEVNDFLDFSNFTGNLESNKYYEYCVPNFMHKPDHTVPQLLKEQWILAKYDRKEFAQDTFSQIWYHNFDDKTGWLWKMKKKSSGHIFRKRYFVLDRIRETLSYYLKANDAEPKSSCHINMVSVYLSPENIDEPNSMQIVFEEDGNWRSMRTLFTYCESSQDMYDWYVAIRSLKWNICKNLNPYTMVPHGYLKQGWLYKTGQILKCRVSKRWFCLETARISYYVHPLDPHPKGQISLICKELCGIEVSYKEYKSIAGDTFCFWLKVPDREYYFVSTNDIERKDWIDKIKLAIDNSKFR